MTRVHPGWLVALCAAVVAVSVWLPWLTTAAGHSSAIGGSGVGAVPPGFGVGQAIALLSSMLLVAAAMSARGLFQRWSAAVALALALILAGLVFLYFHKYVSGPVSVGYGMYVGIVGVVGAVIFSVWALIKAVR